MPVRSPFADVDVPSVNVLDYIFPNPGDVSDKPLWIDADDNAKSLSLRQTLGWVKRLGAGLQRLGLKRGDVVMMCSTNHIFVPVLYLGVVGSTCAFTGANPAYTPKGTFSQFLTHENAADCSKSIMNKNSFLYK